MIRKLFVIMPVRGVADAPSKASMIAEIAKANDWYAHAPEYDPVSPKFNLKETCATLLECDLVLADLTRERPSCYFELGLAEALRRPLFVIAESGTIIHQTSRRDSVEFYSTLEGFGRLVSDFLKR